MNCAYFARTRNLSCGRPLVKVMATAELSTSYPETPSRLIDLEGTFNFRDLGGYRTLDGRSIRWRSLFRADGLYRLTPDDLEQLRTLGLRTVIDLRTEGEVTGRGRIQWPTDELAYHHLPMIDVVPSVERYASWIQPITVAVEYRDMLASGRATIAGALRVLANPAAYPAVYHCMAGKDRTGILSALVLGLLGVSDQDIVADYALSAQAMARMLDWLRRTSPEALVGLGVRSSAMLAAEPRTMAIFLERFRAEHGSFAEYTADLGFPGLAAQLQAVLLEP